MFRPTILKIVLTVVFGVGYYFVCANAHIDYFPCETKEKNLNGSPAYKVNSSDMCSIMAINDTPRDPKEYAKLSGAGYVVAGLSFTLLPLLIAFPLGHAIGRKRKESDA